MHRHIQHILELRPPALVRPHPHRKKEEVGVVAHGGSCEEMLAGAGRLLEVVGTYAYISCRCMAR